MMKSDKIIVSLAVLGVGLISSRADIIDPAFLPSTPGSVVIAGSGTPVNLGLQFTPVANSTVNALGFYGNGGQELYTGEQVAIYNNTTQALVAEATVGKSGPLTDGYYWQSITPVTLAAGQEYVVDAQTGTGGNYWGSGVEPIVNSAITYDGQAYLFTSTLEFPSDSAGHAADAYYGPNFSITPTPEPASWISGALVIGFFAGSRVLRAVKKNRAA